MNHFQFMDETPNFGENYYRIKTFAPELVSSYSNVALAMVKPKDNQRIMVYPNPAQDEVTIHFLEKVEDKAKVHIVNTFGQVLHTFTMDNSQSRQTINISDLPGGVYYLKFDNPTLKRFGYKLYKVVE